MQMGPIMRMNSGMSIKSGNENIDSTFIYSTDTLVLPVFDDFSSNKFQNYIPDFNDPSVYFEQYFHLTDPNTFMPINGATFTSQPTFKRVYDLLSGTFTDSVFSSIQVRVGDLQSYPVQYESYDLFPTYYIIDTINDFELNLSDTVWIENPEYIQDSATVFFQYISDPNKIWIDKKAFHNYRYASNPHSLGIVSFDGLDENGNPYIFGSTASNYADELTSKAIKLGNYTAGDSIYLSFLYQPEGLGDMPEPSDSLIVEFFAPEDNNWNWVWSVSGAPNHDFKSVAINISSDKYLKNGFRFRFRNYGSVAGSLDHFHIDYVHLRNLSGYNDTLNKDFAFSYPLVSLLDKYTSVPWDHYVQSVENKMSDSLKINLFNGSDLPENYQDGLIEVFYNGTLESSIPIPGFDLAESNINYEPRKHHISYHDLTMGYEFDRGKLGKKQMFKIKASANAQFPNFSENDSTVFEQEFYNYYSYDDGSAEAAFGPTGAQARLAIAYDSYIPDSLIGIAICFVPSVNDVSDKQFLLSVWADDNGIPGDLLYEDDVFYPRSPVYGYGKNFFKEYYFIDTMRIYVENKFHIGWRQLNVERLNAGLDRNVDNANKINYSIDGGDTWLNSPFPGSAMIRPIFSTQLNDELTLNENLKEKLRIYPNPTSSELFIEYHKKLKSRLITLHGEVMKEEISNYMDLSDLPKGVYFLYLEELNILKKVIKF